MITRVVSPVDSHGNYIREQDHYYCLSTDTKPTEGVRNADILYIMDWNDLSSDAQAACGAQVWMYDAENKKWLPQ